MYVRLKHTLSSLALEMLGQAPRNRPIVWLLAYARLAPDGDSVPVAALQREAAQLGAAGPRSLRRLEALGLLHREEGRIRLAPEYLPHRDYFVRQVERLEAALRRLERAGDSGDGRLVSPLRLGLILFNAGLFFECHEFLEDVWRATRGADREFYHGIIQIAAAFYHFEKGNQHGARTLLEKAISKLQPYRPRHLGVNVDSLLADLAPWTRRFAGTAERPPAAQEFPMIRVRATI